MKATIYQASGYKMPAGPEGKRFSLNELQKIVGGLVQFQKLPKTGGVMVMNEEGELKRLPPNAEATKIWKQNFPDSEFPINNPTDIYGDVLVCDGHLVR